LKQFKFNIKYKIAGDFDFFTKVFRLENISFFVFKRAISIIDPNGLGRNKELYHKEYSEIILNYVGLFSYLKYRLNHFLNKWKMYKLIKYSF
jgi:hypothetical protein